MKCLNSHIITVVLCFILKRRRQVNTSQHKKEGSNYGQIPNRAENVELGRIGPNDSRAKLQNEKKRIHGVLRATYGSSYIFRNALLAQLAYGQVARVKPYPANDDSYHEHRE